MMQTIEFIAQKVRAAERISPEEALVLWHEAPLALLGELAMAVRYRLNGRKLFYNRNFHIEPTNRCVFNCRFCSYRRPVDSPEMWDYSMEEVEAIARSQQPKGITEVHIVGGVHPDHGLEYYCKMIRRVKKILPQVAIKAFTAIELSYMIRQAGLTIEEGLQRLIDAGMEAIPGGGAEIFDEEIRAQMAANAASRREKQPLDLPSAGSYFKRPEGHFAGKLIEDCGLKGLRVGDAMVSPKHAGFIVNVGEATYSDVLQLEEKIKEVLVY